MVARIVSPRAWLMRVPSRNSPKETELLFGHSFLIEKTKKKWAFGQAMSPIDENTPVYEGWVRKDELSRTVEPRTHHIIILKAPIFRASDIKSRVLRLLPLGAQINAARIGDSFIELASGGFVHRKHVLPLGAYSETDFVKTAEAHMGLPYIWGGISTDGLDCSGLVQSALRSTGRDCARDSGAQESALGDPVKDPKSLQRGDVVFWPGHVGIMSSADRLLHANAFHMRVASEPLSTAISRIGEPRQIKRLKT